MKGILTFISVLILSGCGSNPISNSTQVVKVPVPIKCEPSIKVNLIENYPFNNAKKEMSAFEKYQLASEERKLLRAENLELRAALAECTK